jgi:hypothetical protein
LKRFANEPQTLPWTSRYGSRLALTTLDVTGLVTGYIRENTAVR